MRKNKNKKITQQYTKNPYDTSKPIKGESELHFKNLPKVLDKPNKIDPAILQDQESLRFAEFELAKYWLERFGDDIPRIALMLNVTPERARKVIDDVYNIGYGLTANSSVEQRRRHKLRHMGILDKMVDKAFAYLDGEHGELSPGEFKQITEVTRNCLSDKAKMLGIGNTVIFEQFNTQNNINITPAQQDIQRDKDKRKLLAQLQDVLTTMDDDDSIVEGEVVNRNNSS